MNSKKEKAIRNARKNKSLMVLDGHRDLGWWSWRLLPASNGPWYCWHEWTPPLSLSSPRHIWKRCRGDVGPSAWQEVSAQYFNLLLDHFILLSNRYRACGIGSYSRSPRGTRLRGPVNSLRSDVKLSEGFSMCIFRQRKAHCCQCFFLSFF